MEIVIDDYASFDLAKKLKDVGFPQNIEMKYCYDADGELCLSAYDGISRPTLSLVSKWFREEKNIDINIDKIIRTPKQDTYYLSIVMLEDIVQETFAPCNTYEEALIIGIEKAIELIK